MGQRRTVRVSVATMPVAAGLAAFACLLGSFAGTRALAAQYPARSLDARVRYFAFGSNLDKVKLSRRIGSQRIIEPLPGKVEGYRLAFNMRGGGAEPSFAAAERCRGGELHGCVYDLSREQFGRLCLSEGLLPPVPVLPQAGAYRAIPVDVQLYGGGAVEAVTLEATPLAKTLFGKDVLPSERYLNIMRTAAREVGLAEDWVRLLDAYHEDAGRRPGRGLPRPFR